MIEVGDRSPSAPSPPRPRFLIHGAAAGVARQWVGDLLAIYLNDHLAGATLGVELARRLRGATPRASPDGPALAEVCSEIEADRETLVDRMGRLEDPARPAQAGGGVGGREARPAQAQRAADRLLAAESGQVELEGLLIGIAGKEQMWKALAHTLGPRAGEVDFARLAERAERQRAVIGDLHLEAAAARRSAEKFRCG